MKKCNHEVQQLLRQKEAADHLDVSPRTLERWRVVGGGPRYVKCGRVIRYRMFDLEAWIELQSRSHTHEAA